MLAVKNVSRIFGDNQAGFQNVDFSVQKGEIIGFLGTSGSGKSTLLRVLSGLDPEYHGEISFTTVKSSQSVGMVFQEPRLMPWLNVIENCCFGSSQKKKDASKAKDFLELVGLSGFEKHLPKDLSGGMAQRAAIARALLTDPDLLLLDEPFSALDAFTKMQLQDLLLSIWQKRKVTMLLVTHDIDEALYLCDRIFILKGQPGEIIQELKIAQPRPRSRGDATLYAKKEKILQALQLS